MNVVLIPILLFCPVTSRLVFLFQSSDGSFPAACSDIAVKHMECLINKRETAYQIAVKLAGKEKCEAVLPYYEDNKKKALDMIKIYKESASDQKSSGFWG